MLVYFSNTYCFTFSSKSCFSRDGRVEARDSRDPYQRSSTATAPEYDSYARSKPESKLLVFTNLLGFSCDVNIIFFSLVKPVYS